MNTRITGFAKPITWLTGLSTGWGNGYAVIPEGHKFHGKHYDEIDVNVHGGLTFSSAADELDWPEITDEHKGGWVVGFDCAHYGDTPETCPEEYVKAEVESLIKQLTN